MSKIQNVEVNVIDILILILFKLIINYTIFKLFLKS